MNIRDFWYKYFEYDRVGERKIKKSIELWHKGGAFNHLRARMMWNHIRKHYNCNIFPGITVGKNLRIEHSSWIAIGQTAVLGDNVRIYSRVDITAKVVGDEERNAKGERRHAKIGNDVILGNGCMIIGPVTIGDDCIIGARALVTHDVPPHSIVIGTNQIKPKNAEQKAPTYKKLD
ncbi:MAG: hypothetical protein E7264_06045 [Lachnospiraceae bacterium]|nr:hypothetical protein [Lachnospiraceae bacterium]